MSEPHQTLKTWEDIQRDILRIISRAMVLTNVAMAVVVWIEYVRTGIAFSFVTIAAILSIAVSVLMPVQVDG